MKREFFLEPKENLRVADMSQTELVVLAVLMMAAVVAVGGEANVENGGEGEDGGERGSGRQ